MKSLVDLLEHLLLDCGRRSGAPCRRDVVTLRRRAEHEGDSFVTITLPAFCQDFERSLDQGRIAPGSFASFRKWRSGIPSFLKGFLRKVFSSDGTLLSDPCVDCIRSVRQICLFGKKIERSCSSERLTRATQSFVECDSSLTESLPESVLAETYKRTAVVLCNTMCLDEYELALASIPKHGPGATREHLFGNQKWRFPSWHRRLHQVGLTWNGFASGHCYAPGEPVEDMPTLIEPGTEKPVKVVFVPKTLKTPRVIAVEPVCMQYMQQAMAAFLRKEIGNSFITSGHVNFTRQEVNQEIAKDASLTGFYATLDMSEASDRVSTAHVRTLFGSRDGIPPNFWNLISACRSTRAELPDGRVIDLKKFASMGSALCFPVESLVFFTSIIASRLNRAGILPTTRSVYSFSRDVYVYGDDLIVPADEAPAICDDLEALGFKVNRRKSFWTGKFRESCGSDCYDNELVTPVYLRRDIPTSRGDVSGILSSVATSNQLYQAGYVRCATALRKAVEVILGPLPEVPLGSPAIGWNYHSEVVPVQRWNDDLQRVEALCWVAVPPRVVDPLDGYPALAKCLLRISGSDSTRKDDVSHLATSPRPYSLTLKRRWVALTA